MVRVEVVCRTGEHGDSASLVLDEVDDPEQAKQHEKKKIDNLVCLTIVSRVSAELRNVDARGCGRIRRDIAHAQYANACHDPDNGDDARENEETE
jgi:hypothetical protein